MTNAFLARYGRKVYMDPNSGCWIWLGAVKARDYGLIRVNRRLRLAHVLAYEMTFGPVPKGKELDHKCRVHPCVRPDHCEAVTHRVNVLRGLRAVKPSHCHQGHPMTGDNIYVSVGKRSCRICTL